MKEVEGGSEPRPWHVNTHPFSSLVGGGVHIPSEVDAAERAVLGSPGEKKPNYRNGDQSKRTKNNGWKERNLHRKLAKVAREGHCKSTQGGRP